MMLEVVPSWFATQKKELLLRAVDITSDDLDLAEQVLSILINDKKELDNKHLGILQDIDNNGGKRLEQIDNEIRQHEKYKGVKQNEFDDYEKLVKQCKLETVANENNFLSNIKNAKEINENCILKETDLKQQRDDVMSELRKYDGEIQEEKKELESLKERQTQIPGWLVSFRLQLCSDLQIAEVDLPFVGELLQVNENEQAWEGAVEKLLRDAGISLLVYKDYYRSVSKYVNDNVLRGQDGKGIKLTYLEADTDNLISVRKDIADDSVAYKVDIKPE